MKISPLLATILLAVCAERASAQIFLYNGIGVATTGNIIFNDTPAGGFLDPNPTSFGPGDLPMNLFGWMNYTSGAGHVDSATMNVDITQTVTSIPWFAVTATLSQATSVNGDTAILTAASQTGFEGFMTGVNPALSTPLLGYAVSGILGTNTGAFVSLNAQLDYYVTGGPLVGSLFWNYSNFTPGPYATTVNPVWVGGVLPGNLITVIGSLTLQADPSSISIAPAHPVPEPTACVSLFLGAAALAGRRRRAK